MIAGRRFDQPRCEVVSLPCPRQYSETLPPSSPKNIGALYKDDVSVGLRPCLEAAGSLKCAKNRIC